MEGMKEYIEMAALKRELAPYEENDFSQQMDVILAIVDAQPTADVAPVVRCRECKYHKPIDYCEKHKKTGWLNDDFCSRGQRKEAHNAGT